MYSNGYQEYADSQVLTADPAKLVQMMYTGAIDAVSEARRALAAGDILLRSGKITKATEIINELALSLDHSQAPELCKNLAELYDYMCRRLIDANVGQIDSPLAEVQGLLNDLLLAWNEIQLSRQYSVDPVVAYSGSGVYESVSYAY